MTQENNKINEKVQQLVSTFKIQSKSVIQNFELGIKNEMKQSLPSTQKIKQQESIKENIRKQLISMEFDEKDIEEALIYCNDLDKAIQFIITKLEQNQQMQSKMTKQVKMFLIARMDLKMGPGKVAAQVGHAVLKAFQMMRNSTLYNEQSAKILVEWLQNGQKNKILKVQTQNQLYELIQKAKKKSINCCYIRDAGRTQIAAGSTTVAAIGPIQQNLADFLFNLKEL